MILIVKLVVIWRDYKNTCILIGSSIQFSSVTQSCPTLCDPLNHSTPGLPLRHQLLQFTQTHFHWVGDAIQPSHLLLSPSPPASNPSQHQGLFQWVNSSHEVAKILEFQLQHQAFQWTPRTDLLKDGPTGSPCSSRDSQESSPTTQFKSISFSALSFLHSPTLTSIHDHWKNHSLKEELGLKSSNNWNRKYKAERLLFPSFSFLNSKHQLLTA